jgi:hypothetical protein
MNIAVLPQGTQGCVEYTPARAESTIKLFLEQRDRREHRAQDISRTYKWRRIGRLAWQCTKPDGTIYTQRLDTRHCTCPDWPRISSVGGTCKHFICAEIAEERYQDHMERVVRKEAA